MGKLLTCDTAIADVVIPLSPPSRPDLHSALNANWEHYNETFWKPQVSSKVVINEATRDAMLCDLATIYDIGKEAVDVLKDTNAAPTPKREALHTLLSKLTQASAIQVQSGGTALNIAQPLLKAFNRDQLNITMLTSLGTGPLSDVLRNSLIHQANPPILSPHTTDDARTAITLAYLRPDPINPEKSSRSIAKFDGNFAEMVTPENTKPVTSEKTNAVLLLGTLLQKNKPMFKALLDKATRDQTDLYFAMPTARSITTEHQDMVKKCIGNAKVVLSNFEEIGYLFGLDDKASQSEVKAHLPEFAALLPQGCQAFITRSEDGAWILEKGKGQDYTLREVPIWCKTAPNTDPPPAKNKVGAGDKAFAGFLMGHFAGHKDPVVCAHMGMAMAHQRLMQDSQQIENPELVYQQAVKVLEIPKEQHDPRLTIEAAHAIGSPAIEVTHAK